MSLRVGPYEVFTVTDGTFALDGGAMFGTVPRILWQKHNPPDEQNRIDMALRCLVIRGEGRTVLVDLGIGNKFDPKRAEMFKVRRPRGLLAELSDRGVDPASVTDVIFTHLHFDHAGGVTVARGGNGEARTEILFPQATYHIQKEHWSWAKEPNDRERASFLREDVETLSSHDKLSFLEGEQEVFPGVSVMLSHGHTRAMQIVKVGTGEKGDPTVVHCGDLIPTSTHLRTAWVMGYDLWPLTIIEEKKRLLELAHAEDWVLVFEHDPGVPAARIGHDGKYYTCRQPFDL